MKKLATIITTAKSGGLGITIKKALNECLGFALFYPLGFAGQQS